MTDRDVRERDILVAPNEYAYVQDLTKGHIVLYLGPTKISLSNTERMILLAEGRFVPVRGGEAELGVLRCVQAGSSQYVVLENPVDDPEARPLPGANSAVRLRVGRKVVVPGPCEFPLWPGQRAEVVDGHSLRRDEYLVVQVYDDTFDETLPPIGTERIVRGTDVSFYVPESGLEVIPREGSYVRPAWRLDSKRGLHLRVLAPFVASEGDVLPPGSYEAGQDLFLRGREGYFTPTERIEVLGAIEAVPLAEDEGVYVRSLETGVVRLERGPTSFLLDPTREQLAFRHFSDEVAGLYGVAPGVTERAPCVLVPPSTAVMIVRGQAREAVRGPRSHLLGFDEDLELLQLSAGRPKGSAQALRTCFLRVDGNKVSDVVRVETADHVSLELLLSYRVSFLGKSERWFNVEDYVGLLCDHMSSIIRATARTQMVERFHAASTPILRDAVLGARQDEGRREGRRFEENGMWVYDLEVLSVRILDAAVAGLLGEAQRLAIMSEIDRQKQALRLGDARARESVSRAVHAERMQTLAEEARLEAAQREVRVAQAKTTLDLDKLETVGRARHSAEAFALASEARLDERRAELTLEQASLGARAAAFREQMEAMAPELIATLRSLGNQRLAGELTKNLSPLAILGGGSVAEVAERLLSKLPLAIDSDGGDLGKLIGLGGASTEAAE